MKPTVAIVRGKFLNRYEMQFYEPLIKTYRITAFGSLYPYHDRFAFPVVKLPSPMDLSCGAGSRFVRPILNRLFTDAHYLLGLEDRLRGFDIVHTAETYFRYTQQCLDAKRKGYVKKVIATVLENIPFNNEGIRGRAAYKLRARRELDHIIALTHKTKEALLSEGADSGKITVIPHFVDSKRFAPSKEAVLRRKSHSKSLTILFAGRLEEYKGVFDILQAIQMLKKDRSLRGVPFRMVFVGNGSQKEKMERQEWLLGLSDIVSHTEASYDDMPAVYNQADIFIAPSVPTPTYDEQYCTVLLEAQANGLPIVTTRTGGIPENVGNAAVMVAPGDIMGLKRSIKGFITDTKLRVGYAYRARQRAMAVHDIHIGAEKLSAVYRNVLS